MRVMVLAKVDESQMNMEPTPEMVAAFKAMDEFTEELVKAGVFVAGAGLKPSAEGKRVVFDGKKSTVIDGPFAESREMVVGFSIWEVKDMGEAMTWVMRSPTMPGHAGVTEIRPFYEVADLSDFVTPEELAAPREGERGKLGVA